MLSLTSNTAALVAQRNLATNNLQANKSIARLSSGSRLSSVSDDASAFAIGNKLRSGIAGLEQASNNAAQGASLIQVATGGLERTVDILTRMKTLATQVVNGTLGATERSFAQQEFDQLIQQIDSIAGQTRFNGVALLNGGTGRTLYANNTKSATGLTLTTNGFTGALDTASSSGFVNFTFSGPNSVKVEVRDGVVNLDIAGEVFKGSSSVAANGSLVLTSQSDPNNKLAFTLGADVSGIDTDGELQSGLATLLANATLKIGFSEDIVAGSIVTASSFDASNLLNIGKSSGVINSPPAAIGISAVNVFSNSSGTDYTVEVNIDGEIFRATGVSASPGGVLELVSTTNNGNVLALNYDQTDVSGFGSSAAQFETALESVLVGTTGSIIIGNPESAFGLSAVTNAFTGTLDPQNTKGFIDGIAKSTSVKQNGGAFDIEVQIGNQIFATKGFTAATNGRLNLVSTSDPDNVISFTLDATVSSLDSTAEIKASLDGLLGLDPNLGRTPARFQSASANNDGTNGLEMGSDQSIKAGPGTPPGTYAFSYDATNRVFKLTDGLRVMTKPATQSGDQTITFENGVSIKLGVPGNSFNLEKSITQSLFTVTEGDGIKLGFQISDIPGDEIQLSLTSTTVKALGLTGAAVSTVEGARDAGQKIEIALTNVNSAAATLGAQQSRFEFIQANIATQVENLKSARATFTSVNVATESTALAQSQAQVQAAISQLAQANQLPQQLLRLLGG
jgi:flagellin